MRPLLLLAPLAGVLAVTSAGSVRAQVGGPTVSRVEVSSSPGDDGGYAIGDTIEVAVTFTEAVTVTGVPQITLHIGRELRTAYYDSVGSTGASLLFAYTVAENDEDSNGISVVSNSLLLNGGSIRSTQGSANADLDHDRVAASGHRVDGIRPTVSLSHAGEAFVNLNRPFNVSLVFSEPVFGLTAADISVNNGTTLSASDVAATDEHPAFTRWDVGVSPAGEGPVTVNLEENAVTDAVGNRNLSPASTFSIVAADPVVVEVSVSTSSFDEGGTAGFMLTRSRDNGTTTVAVSVQQVGDFFSGAMEVSRASAPDSPLVVELGSATSTVEVTFEAGETSKSIRVPTEDDNRYEPDGSVTLRVTAIPGVYRYIPGYSRSAIKEMALVIHGLCREALGGCERRGDGGLRHHHLQDHGQLRRAATVGATVAAQYEEYAEHVEPRSPHSPCLED